MTAAAASSWLAQLGALGDPIVLGRLAEPDQRRGEDVGRGGAIAVARAPGAEEASDRIELHVGRDLQFIRINGTVVGALAGLVIYTVAQILF